MKHVNKILNKEAKQRIVFLNPMGVTSLYWLQHLKIQQYFEDHELVFVDYPGYAPVQYYPVDSLESLAKTISGEVQQLPEKPTMVIGFSYGGNVAIYLSTFMNIDKLIVIGTTPFTRKDESRGYEFMEQTLEEKGLFDFSKALIDYCYNSSEKATNPFLHLTLYSSLKLKVNPKGLAQQLYHLKTNVVENPAKKKTIPLVIKGRDDATTTDDFLDRYDTLFNDIVYQEYSDTGHFVLDFQPDAMNLIKTYINQ
ncbi:MAG: alpha/beta hydrolase [Bacteroidetes bacterium]|nr:MAG: alpha/beta hydrolase [Bacteroidota bacterium]